jgi:hypothetical protein
MELVHLPRLRTDNLDQFHPLDVQVLFCREQHPLVHQDDPATVLVVLVEPLLGVFGVFDLGTPLTQLGELGNEIVDLQSIVVVRIEELEHEVITEIEHTILQERLEFRSFNVVVLLAIVTRDRGLGLVKGQELHLLGVV